MPHVSIGEIVSDVGTGEGEIDRLSTAATLALPIATIVARAI